MSSQEYVFGEVYKEMGLNEEEIIEHFTGIGFLVRESLAYFYLALEPYGEHSWLGRSFNGRSALQRIPVE